jgi:hypothetical protein
MNNQKMTTTMQHKPLPNKKCLDSCDIRSDMRYDNLLMLQTMKWVTSGKQLTNYNDSYTHSLTMKKLHSPKGVCSLGDG